VERVVSGEVDVRPKGCVSVNDIEVAAAASGALFLKRFVGRHAKVPAPECSCDSRRVYASQLDDYVDITSEARVPVDHGCYTAGDHVRDLGILQRPDEKG
jgi:hypothetical protein